MIQSDDLTTKIWFYLGEKGFVSIFAASKLKMIMNHDIPQPLPSRSIGAQDSENSRIKSIANELRRRCGIHEAEFGTILFHYEKASDFDDIAMLGDWLAGAESY